VATGDGWREEEILITVRAYPEPSQKYIETSCVAGITRDGQVRRLHPIPDRAIEYEKRFRKYDVVRLRVQRSGDPRPESHRVDLDSMGDVVEHLDTKPDWSARDRWVEPFRAPSMEALQDDLRSRPVGECRSLALIRPRSIERFWINPRDEPGWTDRDIAKLGQTSFVLPSPANQLEFIPFRFYYRFFCDDARCRGHRMSVIDWEAAQAYRRWRADYGERWPEKFREKFDTQLRAKDLQFFVGTMRKRPRTFMIVGLYYPPRKLKVPDVQPLLLA
jgi:hypothetical protein